MMMEFMQPEGQVVLQLSKRCYSCVAICHLSWKYSWKGRKGGIYSMIASLQCLVSSSSCRNTTRLQQGKIVVGQKWWMSVKMAVLWSAMDGLPSVCRWTIRALPKVTPEVAVGEAQPFCVWMYMIPSWIEWAGCEGKGELKIALR